MMMLIFTLIVFSYNGIVVDPNERDSLAKDLGPNNKVKRDLNSNFKLRPNKSTTFACKENSNTIYCQKKIFERIFYYLCNIQNKSKIS